MQQSISVCVVCAWWTLCSWVGVWGALALRMAALCGGWCVPWAAAKPAQGAVEDTQTQQSMQPCSCPGDILLTLVEQPCRMLGKLQGCAAGCGSAQYCNATFDRDTGTSCDVSRWASLAAPCGSLAAPCGSLAAPCGAGWCFPRTTGHGPSFTAGALQCARPNGCETHAAFL